jgi:hypothetical protein
MSLRETEQCKNKGTSKYITKYVTLRMTLCQHIATIIEVNLISTTRAVVDSVVIINNAMDANGAQLSIKIFTYIYVHLIR